MDASVNTLHPLAVDLAIIAAGVGVESLREGHRLVARVALLTNTLSAVTLAVGDTSSAVVHEGVGGEHQLDLPVSVRTVEELSLELTMKADVLVLDQDTALVAHITGRGTRVLIVMAVVLDSKAGSGGLPVATDRELLGVVARPDLDLIDVAI